MDGPGGGSGSQTGLLDASESEEVPFEAVFVVSGRGSDVAEASRTAADLAQEVRALCEGDGRLTLIAADYYFGEHTGGARSGGDAPR